MRHSIYFYQNEADFSKFIDYIKSLHVKAYSYYGEPLDLINYQYHVDRSSCFFILKSSPTVVQNNCCCVKDGAEYIQINSQYKTGVYLQCGSVIIDIGKNDSFLSKTFQSIKKYIRTQYTISDSKMYYVGPEMYADWINRKVEFPDMFKRAELVATSEVFSFEQLVQLLLSKGYLVKENGKDIRDVDTLNLSKDAYIICKSEANLKTAVLTRELHYLSGSECVFLWRNRRKKVVKYSFQLDYRFKDRSELNEIFLTIEDYLKYGERKCIVDKKGLI